MNVKIKKLYDNAVIPTEGSEKAAGHDLYACLDSDDVVINPHTTLLVKTGIAMEIPEGHVGLIFPRSSISKKDLALTNAVGVIDSKI